jgi:hypothetical protein
VSLGSAGLTAHFFPAVLDESPSQDLEGFYLVLKQASCGLLNIAPWKNLENFHKISQSHTLPPLDESLKRLWTVIFEQDGQFGPICHV